MAVIFSQASVATAFAKLFVVVPFLLLSRRAGAGWFVAWCLVLVAGSGCVAGGWCVGSVASGGCFGLFAFVCLCFLFLAMCCLSCVYGR